MSASSPKFIACVLGLLTVGALAGCGGSAAKKPPPRPPPAPQTFSYADNGRSVTLAAGRRAVVRLQTLNWTFQPIAGSAVRAIGPQRVVFVGRGCSEPDGCGYVQMTIEAVSGGRSVVAAERRSCGEAARCQPGLRKFAMTVLVH